MNDLQVTQQMELYRAWAEMPLDAAKDAMRLHMLKAKIYDSLDFDLLNVSESIEEAIGAVFGVSV